MKKYRTIILVVLVTVFLAAAEAGAQTVADGQPSVLKEDKAQANYVYDLKLLIKKSKDNIKTVNEKIKEQAIIKRNQQREEKAREYYAQALKLQDEGRLEEARQLFDKAIRITDHPEMTYYVKESERRSRLQQSALERQENDNQRAMTDEHRVLLERAEASYAAAVSLYKQQKFHEAKEDFQLVEEMVPDYKAVRSYLQIIEQDIIQADHLSLKEQRNELDRQQKEVEIARLREKELWRKEIDKKEAERQQQLRQQAQGVYDEAVNLYNERKYLAAREKFQQVEWVVPDFKAVRAYLARIENDVLDEKRQVVAERQRELEKQRWEEVLKEKQAQEDQRKALELREQERLNQVKDQAEFVYRAAVGLFEKDLLAQAKDKFDEVEGIYPNYKSARNYLQRIEQFSRQSAEREILKKKNEEEQRMWEEETVRRKEEKEKFRRLISEADAAYEDAMRFYQAGRLIEAKEKLLEVDQRVPDYKSTRSYLKKIDSDIELLAKTQKAQDSMAAQQEELARMRLVREKADVVYAKALAAYDAKDFPAAKAQFMEVDAILSDYKKTRAYLNRIDEEARLHQEALARMERDKKADAAYIQALALYQEGQFEEAKKQFILVESVVPNYKQASDYLDRIDDDIIRKKEADLARMKEAQVQGIYNQAMSFYKSGEYSRAKESFLQVEVIYPGYKETTRILGVIDIQIEKQQKDAVERRRADQAEQIYAQALVLYNSAEFVEAKDKFVKVEVIYSGYKDTLKYLARIDGDIARKSREDDFNLKSSQADVLYAQAVDLYKEFNFQDAKNKFIQVQALCPGYKQAGVYLARIDKDMADLESRLANEEKMRRCDAVYAEAVKLHGNRQFMEAKAKFLELSSIDSGYKNVNMYLKRIDADIAEEASRQKRMLMQKTAAEPYAQAVTLYHDSDFEAAKLKFLEVVRIAPDYQKVQFYLARIDQDIRSKKSAMQKERIVQAEALYKEAAAFMAAGKTLDAFRKFSAVAVIYPDYKAVNSNLDKLRKAALKENIDLSGIMGAEADGAEDKLIQVYKEAVQFYKDKKYVEAASRFEAVEAMKAGYRSTQQYLDSIKEIRAEASLASSTDTAPVQTLQAPVPVAGSVEAVQALDVLSEKSSLIYQQIRALAQDRQDASPQRILTKVDRLIDNLEAERRRVAEKVLQQKKAEASAVVRARKNEKEAVRREAKDAVDQAAIQKKEAHNKAQQQAEDKQAEMARQQDDLRKKERAEFERLKDEQREAQLKAEVIYQQALFSWRRKDYPLAKERFINARGIMPEYKDSGKYLFKIERIQAEAALAEEEAKDRQRIAQSAEKAAALNVEILSLAKQREYVEVEKRFNDLETILKDIQGTKAGMMSRRARFESDWETRIMAHKAPAAPAASLKERKPIEVEGTARERAVALFRAGQQFYAAGQYPQARVKFMESVQADPSYKASMSFLHRVDRVLAKKDFEANAAEGKAGGKPDAQGDVVEDPAMKDPVRAVRVLQEGTVLYKAKRYREARIKFEELSKVGNDADRRYAQRYFNLIEQALEKEKLQQQQQQDIQRERFLQERRAQAKMEWERGKLQQERRRRTTFGQRPDIDAQAGQDDRRGRARNIQRARQQKMPTDAAAAQNQQDQQREKADAAMRVKLVPTDVQAEAQAKERRRLDQLESKTRRQRQLQKEQRLHEAKQEEQKKRLAAEKFRKNTDTDILIRRNQEAVEAILKEDIQPDKPVVRTQPLPQAVVEQKQLLDGRRAAIRKDFENGVERLYNGAVALYRKKLYEEARADFIQVDGLIKGYKKTAQYLKDADKALSRRIQPVVAPVPGIKKPDAAILPAAVTPENGRTRMVTDVLDAFDVNAPQ